MHLSVPICIPQAPAKSLVTMSKVTSFCGLTWETKSNAAKKNWETIWREKKCKWTKKAEITTRKKFLAVGEAHVAIFWPPAGFKGRTFVRLGFSKEGILILCLWYFTVGQQNDGKTEWLSNMTYFDITIYLYLYLCPAIYLPIHRERGGDRMNEWMNE